MPTERTSRLLTLGFGMVDGVSEIGMVSVVAGMPDLGCGEFLD